MEWTRRILETALLNLSLENLELQADYSHSTEEVFIDAMVAMIRSGQLNILAYCQPHLNKGIQSR
jgi:hypothetical protein